jgi:acetyl-CoA C-acetyltransferase
VTAPADIPAFVPGGRRTPVIAGIGQIANKDDDRIVHPMELLEAAARMALDDAGITPARVGGVLATPLSVYSPDDPSLLLASRLGLQAGLRTVTSYTGAAPQHLIAQACQAIYDGEADAVLIVGGIADASVRRARRAGLPLPAPPTSRWSQGSAPPIDGLKDSRHLYFPHVPEMAAGAGMPSAYFALVESAMETMAGQGISPAEHRASLGRLLAPFTDAAARRPDLAWFPSPRSAVEIGDPSPSNRLVAEPYTKLMCSFPTVDLAGALVIAAAAEDSEAVRPLTIVRASEALPPSGRPVYHRSAALERIVEVAQDAAGISMADVSAFDLYSCFPAAVKVAAHALGLGPDDPRPRTASGGLPYLGGPGASYSIHGIACLVEDLRARPGSLGAAVSLGGMLTDFALGVYASGGGPCEIRDLGKHTESPVETVATGEGVGVVEAATVLHDAEHGPIEAPVIARLADGTRIGARAADPALAGALAGQVSQVGREVKLTTDAEGHVTYSPC